jgi:hypothetical protein
MPMQLIVAKSRIEARMKMSKLARPVRFTYLSILRFQTRAPQRQTEKKKTAYDHGDTPDIIEMTATLELVKTTMVAVVEVETRGWIPK